MLIGEIKPNVKDTKKSLNDSNNYRPIMISSNLLKVYEMIVLNVLESKVTLNKFQFGYEKGSSTYEPALLLKEVIKDRFKNKNGKVYALFADLSKAFERLNYRILLDILIEKNFPYDIINSLMYYLRNQSAYVRWGGVNSNTMKIFIGTRQGGSISPFLFKLYVDKMITNVNDVISDFDAPCKIGFLKINILAYADDVVLIAPSLARLKCLYRVFANSISFLKLVINKTKTKCIIFNKNNRFVENENISFDSDEFEICETYKYLGFLFHCNLNDSKDIDLRVNKFYSQYYSMY